MDAAQAEVKENINLSTHDTPFDDVDISDEEDFAPNMNSMDRREAAMNENSPVIVSLPKAQFHETSSRRRHTRHPARWPITAYAAKKRADGQFWKVPFNAFSEDVSKSGIGFLTHTKLKQDDRCVLCIKTFIGGKSKTLNLAAKVKFIALSGDKYRCGAEFINLNEGYKKFISAYIQGKNPHSE